MIKKTTTYVDYNGVERTESHYFHYSQAEILEMEMSEEGGFAERVQGIIDAKDRPALLRLIKKFVIDAYGVKSQDGRRFIKTDDVRAAFLQSPAYSQIFMSLVTNDKLAAEFVNGVVPDEMKPQFEEAMKKRQAELAG